MTRSEELRDVVKSRKFTVLCKAWEVRTTNVDLEAVYIAINQDAKQSKTRQSKAKQGKASQLFMEYSNVTQLGKDSDASEEAFFPSASVESGAELPTKIEKAVNDECAALDLGENAAHRKGKSQC